MGIDLTKTQLFCGIAPAELDALLQCLDVRKRQYKRGSIFFGMVLLQNRSV